jgi:hypothetical protein
MESSVLRFQHPLRMGAGIDRWRVIRDRFSARLVEISPFQF